MTKEGNSITIGEPKIAGEPQIEVEELDKPESTDADNQFLDFGEFNKTENEENDLKSKASFRTGETSRRKPRKALIVDNNAVHARDFKTAKSFLNSVLNKQTTEGGDDTSFGFEIFEKIQAEYDSKLKEPVTDTIKKGGFDKVFPASLSDQNISEINKRLLIQDTKKELEK